MKNNYISQLNFISKHLFTLLVLLFMTIGSVSGVDKTWDRGAGNNNWNSGNNWSPNGVPTADDDVTIPNDFDITVNTAAVCASFTIAGGNRSNTITISNTNSLTVTGAITINNGTGSGDNKIINVGAGTLTAGSVTMNDTGADNIDSYISVSTGTINVSGNITMNGAVARNQIVFTGAGTLNISATGTITGGTISKATGGYTALTSGTVNYNGSAQTIGAYNYYNLTLSGNGAKTLQTATTSIGGNLTLSGATTTTTVGGLTIGGNLSIGNESAFNTAADYSLSVVGTTTIGNGTSGILNLGGWGGTKTFTGLVTVNSGGTWNNSGNLAVTFKGGITNNGTFNSGSGTQTFDTNPQNLNGNINLSGAQTNFNANVTNQGTLTLTANVSGSGSIINASTGTLNLAAYTTVTTVTNQGTLNASGSNNISPATLTNASTGILNISEAAYTAPATFTNQGILTYTSSAEMNTPITNTGTINVQSSGYIAGITNNTRGTLNISAPTYRIQTLTATAADNTVIYSGAGDQTIKDVPYSNLTLSGSGTKTFTAATTLNNFSINNGAIADLGTFTHAASAYYLDGTQKYKGSWGSTASNAVYTSDTNFDVAALGILNITAGNCGPGYWTGSYSADWNDTRNWCDGTIPTASTNVTIPNVTRKPAITATGGLCKNITIETSSSLSQSNTEASNLIVSGNWTNNGTYTRGIGTTTFAGASAQTIGGNNNTSFYNLTIQNTGGVTLARPTTVTRAILLSSGNINTSSTNSLTITNTANSGIMGGSSASYINGPVIWNLPAGLPTGLSYTFPVGNNNKYLPYTLVNPVTGGTAPVVQVQAFGTGSGGTFSNPLTAISSTEYWKLTTISGNFTNTSVSLGKGDAQMYPYNVILQSATVNGAYTSLDGTVGFYDITNSTTTTNINDFFTLGTNNTPTFNILPTVLGGFGYIFNFGPSGEQTFSVNGTSLPADIVISAPTDFEISQTTSVGFTQTITLARDASNNIQNVKIYVRLKANLPVGTYNNESLSVTSSATTKKITLNGTVYATTPSIITSGGKSCDGKTIELNSSSPYIDILYWTGPNNFYSQEANPIVSPVVSPSSYGLYTVTGSIPTGTNLIINGDFEAGNSRFLSSYAFVTGASDNQGIYAITDNAKSVNNAFSPLTPGNKQMVIDGATIANVTVWSQTVSVIPNSTYQFTYYLRREVTNNPSIIQLYANNQALGTPFTASSTVGVYKKYYYNWSSGSNTSVTLDLRNQNTIADGNDFSLDNIEFKSVTQVSASVLVKDDSKADVSISTPSSTVTAGTNVTFTATPTNGGTAPLYQWYVNDIAVGTNSTSPTFNYIPINNDKVKVVMTSNRTCATSNNPATSTVIIMTVTGVSNYWIGTDGTEWWKPSNWTAKKVPAPGDNVEFATGGSTGNNGINGWAINDLYVDNNRRVGNLINNASGKNLIIPANTQLYVNNKVILTPVNANAQYDQIQIKADPNLDDLTRLPNGSLIFHNSQEVNDKVYGSVEMYTKSEFKPNQNEDDTFFWQYFGIPVESIKADPTFYGAYVRKSNEAGDETDGNYYWTELSNNSTLTAFDGYEICQKLDLKYLLFQGQLVNRDFSRILIYSSATGVKYPGQHLLANPYAAAINVSKINFGSDIDASVSLYKTGSYGQWSGNNGAVDGTGPGQFTTIPKSPAGNNGLPQEVPSMSSMLVRVAATRTDANSVLSFNYNDVINKNTTIQKVKALDGLTNTDLISTRIDLTGQHYSDRMWIFTEPSCTRNFDNGWDGRKMLGSSLAPQIYAVEPDGDYQVNSVSDMHNTDLAFQAGDEVEYTLKFTHENIQRQYAGVYLVDLIENKTVDVTLSGSTYTFATAQSDVPTKRFKILTRPYEKGASDMEAQVKIFTAPGRVFVHNLSTFKGECTLYDIAGRAIKNAPFAANAVTEVLNNLTPGAYVVNTITNGETVSKRVIVQ
jgi:hypothetical protein